MKATPLLGMDLLINHNWESYLPIKCQHTANVSSPTLYYRKGNYVLQKQEDLDYFTLFYLASPSSTIGFIGNFQTLEQLQKTIEEDVRRTPITIKSLESIGYTYNPNLYEKEPFVILKNKDKRIKVSKNELAMPLLYVKVHPHPIEFVAACENIEDIDKVWNLYLPAAKAEFNKRNYYDIEANPTCDDLVQKYDFQRTKNWEKFRKAQEMKIPEDEIRDLKAIAEQSEETYRDLYLLKDGISDTKSQNSFTLKEKELLLKMINHHSSALKTLSGTSGGIAPDYASSIAVIEDLKNKIEFHTSTHR